MIPALDKGHANRLPGGCALSKLAQRPRRLLRRNALGRRDAAAVRCSVVALFRGGARVADPILIIDPAAITDRPRAVGHEDLGSSQGTEPVGDCVAGILQ